MKALRTNFKLAFQLLFILGIFSLTTGCASRALEAQVADNVDLKGLKTIFVKKLDADERDIHDIIAAEFNKRGYEATAGEELPAGESYDALVTYQDKWMWDITMYMIELNVQVKDPDTNFVMASGHSHRTSLVRKSKEDMVAEVVGEILK